jgi:aminopeptidase N
MNWSQYHTYALLISSCIHYTCVALQQARAAEEHRSRAAAAAQALAVQQHTALRRVTNRLARHTIAAAAADQHSALHALRAAAAHAQKRQTVLLAVVQRSHKRRLVTRLLQWREESALRGQRLRMMKRLLSRSHKVHIM